ncbi:MAG: hypothetical protein A4E65_03813 [Syntrophorhabdus sp. PtaU1.Bin153]|nr:MAG: hypothetical protein A4E65_03813 [Syntrophorhabdus sp. PtaU1.Bin153]
MESLIPSKESPIIEKILKYAVISISILFLIFILLSIFKVGLVFWFYDRVFDWISARLGFDYYLAHFVALSMTAIFSSMYPYLMWTFLIGRYKLQTTLAIIAASGIMCLLVYTVGGDVYFDRQTGQPLKWYADTPEGRTFSNSPGYDKKFGIKLKPYTTETAQREGEAKKLAKADQRKTGNSLISETSDASPVPDQTQTSIRYSFTPNSIGEKLVGRIGPGKYVYEVFGQYQKRWSNGNLSPLNASKGIYHRYVQALIPFPDKGYGVVFIRVGQANIFPGETFSVSSVSEVFAEANIVRDGTNRNYDNEGSVNIMIYQKEEKE